MTEVRKEKNNGEKTAVVTLFVQTNSFTGQYKMIATEEFPYKFDEDSLIRIGKGMMIDYKTLDKKCRIVVEHIEITNKRVELEIEL